MNKNKTIKNFVISLGLAVLMLSANTLSAQDRGLFGLGSSSADHNNSSSVSLMRQGTPINDEGGISNYGIGESAPLGSGIAVLLVAGLGYLALKKKEDKQ